MGIECPRALEPHYFLDVLLDEDFIRRDMVYFASKNESGATEIYRAKDFGLHKEVSILNAYRAGKLGAKPQLGSIFIDE